MKKETYIRKASEALASVMTDVECKGIRNKTLRNRVFHSYSHEFNCILSNKVCNGEPLEVKRKINLVEICCQLGEIPTEMEAKLNKEKTSYYDREEETYKYNGEYQDVFDKYYNEFWSMLEKRGYINECI